MNAEHAVKRRRVSIAQLDSIVGPLKSSNPTIANALDILSIDSSELISLCNTHHISLTYQDVQSLKAQIASTLLQSHSNIKHWSSLPDLLSPIQPALPRVIFFGNPELDALFPSLPHPCFLELLETKQEGGPGEEDPLCASHQAAMNLTVASAAKGARVLLVDTGMGTEIGKGGKGKSALLHCTALDCVLHL
jgi:hypothetical protein